MTRGTESATERFWAKVDKTDDCWTWTGSTSVDGYGRFGGHSVFGTSLPHRAAWIVERGPVPDGLELDHLCNNRLCVRVSHLEPVTHEENIHRALARRQTCPNGHPITADNRVAHYDVDHGDRCLPCRRKANRESLRRQRARKTPVGHVVHWDVRVWAWGNGLTCNRIGPIPKAIIAAYLAEQERVA